MWRRWWWWQPDVMMNGVTSSVTGGQSCWLFTLSQKMMDEMEVRVSFVVVVVLLLYSSWVRAIWKQQRDRRIDWQERFPFILKPPVIVSADDECSNERFSRRTPFADFGTKNTGENVFPWKPRVWVSFHKQGFLLRFFFKWMLPFSCLEIDKLDKQRWASNGMVLDSQNFVGISTGRNCCGRLSEWKGEYQATKEALEDLVGNNLLRMT